MRAAMKKAPSTVQGAKGNEIWPAKTAQSNPTTDGLLRLHVQACRMACAAIRKGDDELANRFGTVVRSLERAIERRGVAI